MNRSFGLFQTALASGLCFVGLVGCTESSVPDNQVLSAPTYHRDIEPLFAAKCGSCHTEGGIAPFALSTYEQVSAAKGAVSAAVQAKTMPPWLASNDCNSYAGERSLTDAQIAQITQWVDNGAPEGDLADKPVVVEDDRATLSRVDLELSMPEAYTPTQGPDDYRCFFVDWPEQEITYITGLGVKPGETAIVHHVIAYAATPALIPKFQALDDADVGTGWTCFGGPGERAAWVGAWVPGSTGADFPAGTGIEMPVGSKLVVQMHYNTLSAPAVPDQTKLLIRTDKSVEKKAIILPFTNIDWVQNQTMDIPAHTNDVKHEFSGDPTKFAAIISNGAISGNVPLTIYDTSLHMHTRGKTANTRIVRQDGTQECLLDIEQWNFHWQGGYRLAKPTVFEPGDNITLGCSWDNPEMTDINWGEGTGDEMCLATFFITE